MADNNITLDSRATGATMHPYYDMYLNVPYKTKNAPTIRGFVKSLGGRYDSIERRWWIPHRLLIDDSYSQIVDANLFDGWKFVFNPQIDNLVFRNSNYLDESGQEELKMFFGGNFICNMIKDKKDNFEVIFSTGTEAQAVHVSFWNVPIETYNFSDGSNASLRNFYPQKTIVVPKDIGRDMWRHYKNRKNYNEQPVDSDLMISFFREYHRVNVTNV